MTLTIRSETVADVPSIRALIELAFAGAPHRSGREAAIVEALREARQLTLSLVAEEGGIAGHVAVSPVSVAGVEGWFGLGPVSVAPEAQRHGIGAALIGAALARLRDQGAGGCVVLGDPGYYARFGFEVVPGLRLDGVPPAYFMALRFHGALPHGAVVYHPAFDG